MKKQNRAFSLIELSIVILIIGILIAGVIQGGKLYYKFKIQTARQLTQSSAVNGIKDLVLWYEPTLEKSFINSEAVDGSKISLWYDINPQKNFFLNATQNTEDSRPVYKENFFNGLPALVFDGVNDYMAFTGDGIANSDYTIFAVGSRNDGSQFNHFMGGSGSGTSNMDFGWRLSNLFWFQHYNAGGQITYTDKVRDSLIPTMHTVWFSKTGGKKYWFAGGRNTDSADATQTTALTSFSNSALARFTDNFANINIAEIIIFNRALSDEERQAIEAYLSQKYSIPII